MFMPETEDGKSIPPEELGIPESKELTQADFRLTPEIEAMIMEKVQDINEHGTGVHALIYTQSSLGKHPEHPKVEVERKKFDQEALSYRIETLRRILKTGLLGVKRSKTDKEPVEEKSSSKEPWVKNVKERADVLVFFNIIGRDAKRVEDAYGASFGAQDSILVIFTTKPFKEETEEILAKGPEPKNLPPHRVDGYYDYDRGLGKKYKVGHFGAKSAFEYDEKGLPKPGMDDGFALSFRVAPGWFRGIIFRVGKSPDTYNFLDTEPSKLADSNKSTYDMRSKEIALAMISSVKDPSKLLPVYDVFGNMYWPKQMTYDEVKKFVAERDDSKQKITPPE